MDSELPIIDVPEGAIEDKEPNWQKVDQICDAMFNAGLSKAQELVAESSEFLVSMEVCIAALICQGKGTKDLAVLAPLLRAQLEAFADEFEAGLIPVEFEIAEGTH